MYLEKVKQAHDARLGIRLGDFVLIEGKLERISVCRTDSLTVQTTLAESGAWFLGEGNYSEFSGTAVNFKHGREFDKIDKQQLRETGNRLGEFWTFKDGVVGEGRRENFEALCRIFEVMS